MLKQYLETGKITGTHGLRGEMRVQPWCDSPEFLTGFKTLYLDPQGKEPLHVLSLRPHGNMVLLRAEGVESIEMAERYRGRVIYLARADVALGEDCYFVQDLLGCRVFDADSGAEYGEVTDVSKTGANDVWHITKQGTETLIPVIPDVVLRTDVEAGRIEIRPLKGMFSDAD